MKGNTKYRSQISEMAIAYEKEKKESEKVHKPKKKENNIPDSYY